LTGIIRTRVGYCGGASKQPTYHALGGHTETVQLHYDPQIIDYHKLLDFFWENHDPLTRHTKQYQSVIFYHNEEQKRTAEESMKQYQARIPQQRVTVATVILPAEKFYEAENYHQKYLLRQHPSLVESLNLGDEGLIRSHVASKLNAYLGGYASLASFEQSYQKMGLNEEQADYIRKAMSARGAGAPVACGLKNKK